MTQPDLEVHIQRLRLPEPTPSPRAVAAYVERRVAALLGTPAADLPALDDAAAARAETISQVVAERVRRTVAHADRPAGQPHGSVR